MTQMNIYLRKRNRLGYREQTVVAKEEGEREG